MVYSGETEAKCGVEIVPWTDGRCVEVDIGWMWFSGSVKEEVGIYTVAIKC